MGTSEFFGVADQTKAIVAVAKLAGVDTKSIKAGAGITDATKPEDNMLLVLARAKTEAGMTTFIDKVSSGVELAESTVQHAVYLAALAYHSGLWRKFAPGAKDVPIDDRRKVKAALRKTFLAKTKANTATTYLDPLIERETFKRAMTGLRGSAACWIETGKALRELTGTGKPWSVETFYQKLDELILASQGAANLKTAIEEWKKTNMPKTEVAKSKLDGDGDGDGDGEMTPLTLSELREDYARNRAKYRRIAFVAMELEQKLLEWGEENTTAPDVATRLQWESEATDDFDALYPEDGLLLLGDGDGVIDGESHEVADEA